MSVRRPPPLPEPIAAELRRRGLTWEIRPGKKHWKVYAGSRLVTILPHGTSIKNGYSRRQNLNAVRSVKQVLDGGKS